ncbi:kinesin motor catalytic domain protein (macronuclear) [Tetrahymena thermophila SB210]|uniref:Kinesin motor catalytic domain protein n=1 Tax=Tetrahymena thermophila (strain SB210) TaxID=312017 RepID=Q22T57_TETTS|nr:kinesin motor catalytic domain protein [Tetrahymena thermophila SB210]EAR88581.2 kinesin motor catalytic domain protein [Tetrahymena thermophila SB210]|eukprot:XP_001008826.2 kinesin motor catalytic domain protein [Tetrahymena thermophila SB210]
MKLNHPIINSEIDIHKKDQIAQSTKNEYLIKAPASNFMSNNQEDADKFQLQNKIYKGSPIKQNQQTSSSLGQTSVKGKQQASKSFHSQNLIPSQQSLSAQKHQSGEKIAQPQASAQKINSINVNGFADESAKQQNVNQEIFNFQTQKEQQSLNNFGSNSSFNSSNNDTFKVYARVRPINAKEKSQFLPKKRLEIIKTYENQLYVLDPDISRSLENQKEKGFGFDQVFADKDDNQKVYEGTIASLLKDHLLEGYNTTVFAYGQTGAGKTYTLFGDEYKNQDFLEGRDKMAEGIVSLIIKDLFSIFQKNKEFKYSIKVSYLEIYNENIRDLLVDQGNQSNLMIVEDPQKGILIPELSEFQIKDQFELNNLIRKGNSIRVMASTHSNQFSSRSHCIIQINIEKIPTDMKYASHKIVSKLSLIDLAGSERAAVSENKGIRMMEGSKINRSLLALGNCINILSDSKKQGAYVPYRDSKLTRLLKDSLGGTTKTVMIACVAPSFITYEETLNTLKYAQRAKNIQNKIKQNVVDVDIHVSQYKEIIDNLKLEIESLKKQLNSHTQKQEFNSVKSGLPVNESNRGSNQDQKDNGEMEELSGQIFLNIEENWEITQTLKDLEQLRQKNQQNLIARQEEQKLLLKTTMTEQVKDEILKLSQEIQTIQANMDNNDKVFQELQNNLEKNNQQKKQLREKIKLIVESNENGQEKSLEETCRLLQLEKMDLFSQNIEIKKEAQTLALEKEKTVNKLKQMEREMELMKQQLQEKDKIISKSSQIITQLKQKEQQQQQKELTKTPQNQQKESNKFQTNNNKEQKEQNKKSVTTFQNLNFMSPQIQSSQNKRMREKSATHTQQDMNKLQSSQNQATLLTQERTPVGSQNIHEIYYRPKEPNRQLSSNRQEQGKKKRNSNNFSQTNLQIKNQSLTKDKILSPQQQSSVNVYASVKYNNLMNLNDNKVIEEINGQEEIKKEYYYFDQNKKLQKRIVSNNNNNNNFSSNNFDDKRLIELMSHHKIQQINIYKSENKLDEQSSGNAHNQQNDKKEAKGFKLDLDSLKKFDEIQKVKSEKKQNENTEKVQNKQEVVQNKQKGKKKNKHKHNIIEEKITIDELKNYAQKLKDIDFENVKIKPNLKKFQKNSDNNPNNNNQISKNQVVSQHRNSSKQSHENNKYPNNNNNNLQTNLNSLAASQKFEKDNQNANDNRNSMNIDLEQKKNNMKKQCNQNQYEQEIIHIQGKIAETQNLISSLKLNNEGEVINDFQQKKINQIFEEYSNLDKNMQQKLHYYSKSEKKKDKSADPQDFEKYLQQITIEDNQQDLDNKNEVQLVDLNDISCMNKIADVSADMTIKDFLYNIEKAEMNQQNHFHLSLDPKQYGYKQQKQQHINQQTPDKNNKLNLKSLDEARVKVRSFKHQLATLNDKIKSSQVNPDIINQMKLLIKQYEQDQYALSATDENILKEFKRILIVFKEYDGNSNNSKSKPSSSQQKQMSNQGQQSTNPSYINYTSTSSSNQISQTTYTTRPRSINSVTEEAALQNHYYQQNNFNGNLNNIQSNSNKRENTNQSSQNHTNQSHHNHFNPSNNISVNKKQIEPGAFSKILNNYGEAAKVINSSSSQPAHNNNNISSNIKKYGKGLAQTIGESRETSHRNSKIPKNQIDKQKNNSRQNIDNQLYNSQNQSEIINSQGVSYSQPQNQQQQNEIKKDQNDSLVKSIENFNKNNISNNIIQNSAIQAPSGQSNISSSRGKSVTSYVQINNKRKSFKEDTDKPNIQKQEQQLKQISSDLLRQLDQEQNSNQII